MRLFHFVSLRPGRRERGDTLENESKMQSKISTAQLELFNESALPEAVTLHADRPGFFSLLVKPAASTPRQTSYRVDVLPQVLAALDPDIDSYMSQADVLPSESPPGQSLASAAVLRGSGYLQDGLREAARGTAITRCPATPGR